ncbi:lipid A-modifier LpxR family protein [Halobacteriovorax sp. RT-2-4]|uniref:lipid A-modifier LpxR family protein n=1 Tax=unclassified Halobacteriovorax TaxID=2639665 RepID=UPI00399B1526
MKLFFIVSIFTLTLSAFAQSRPLNEFSIKIDNDAPFETDRYYSNGLELMYQRRLYSQGSLTKLRFGVAHKIYTPEATLSTTVVEGDHPYTGLLYGILGISHVNSDYYLRADLWTGQQGPSAKAGILQNIFHKMTPSSQVNGWQNQISNQYFFNGEFKIIKINRGPIFELSPWLQGHYGGLKRDVEIGLKFGMRLGFFELFANGSYVANFFDAVLQGSKKVESVYVISDEDMEDIYYKADAGFNLFFRSMRVTLKANWHGPQFKGATNHTFATLETSFYF